VDRPARVPGHRLALVRRLDVDELELAVTGRDRARDAERLRRLLPPAGGPAADPESCCVAWPPSSDDEVSRETVR
jgi:hypothetical protein